MAKEQERPLTFEEFRNRVAQELELDKGQLTEDTRFYDLMVDSIRMVEMLLHFEEQGIEIPLEMAWQIETVRDAYDVYRETLAGAGALGPRGLEAKHAEK